jgi:hypothetical protein
MAVSDPKPNPGVNPEASALFENRDAFDAAVRAHCQQHGHAPPSGGGGGK